MTVASAPPLVFTGRVFGMLTPQATAKRRIVMSIVLVPPTDAQLSPCGFAFHAEQTSASVLYGELPGTAKNKGT